MNACLSDSPSEDIPGPVAYGLGSQVEAAAWLDTDLELHELIYTWAHV